MVDPSNPLTLLAMVGVSDSEIPVLAELHRNPGVHLVGVYDPDPNAIGHEMAEILGLRHGHSHEFLHEIASAGLVVLAQDRERVQDAVSRLHAQGVRMIGLNEALELYGEPGWPPRRGVREQRAEGARWQDFEDAMRWLDRALDREEVLRGLLSLLIQAVDSDSGSIQLLNHATKELYIAYADGLSDHTIRSSRRRLGEGISGRVALSRTGEIIEGQPTAEDQRDRSDIQSAICVPLLDGEILLGVASVSRDRGCESFSEESLATVERMAHRITPVLSRLLEIQSYHERALVDDLEKGLERLLQLDVPLTEGLGLMRDLLEDLSGAETCHLIILGNGGPALRVMAGDTPGAPPRCARDIDSSTGILGQVLLTGEIVIMEERVRLAGQTRSRHFSRLYVPLGSPECFAVFVAEFEGLSTLAHFQRNLTQVQNVITSRLGRLLGREESRGRMDRLTRLAKGLSELGALTPEPRLKAAARILEEITAAECVAAWDSYSIKPIFLSSGHALAAADQDRIWKEIHRRRTEADSVRVVEEEPVGTGLRSMLLVSDPDGNALAAFERHPQSMLEEVGFREEDLEGATLLLQGLTVAQSLAPEAGPADGIPQGRLISDAHLPVDPMAYTANRLLLREALERELQRAQRYHFGFSLTCFQISSEELDRGRVLRLADHVLSSARSTDCVLFIAPGRFAVLAPEESRGQRRLARRYREVLEDFRLEENLEEGAEIRLDHSRYPHDADGPDELLRRSQIALGPAPD